MTGSPSSFVPLPEDGEVEHGLVERDRDEVARLELQRAGEVVAIIAGISTWRTTARGSRDPAGPAPS